MNLSEAIAHAQGCYEEPPKFEWGTLKWAIWPLLKASGYLDSEIILEPKGPNVKYFGHSILPNTDFTWCLEAKAWEVALRDNHVTQALNYASHNGKRWVVLSNGKFWRLYDNCIQGIAAEKFVVAVSLKDTVAMTEFLTAIGKESIQSNFVEEYALQKENERLRRLRSATIADELSEEIFNPGPLVPATLALQMPTGSAKLNHVVRDRLVESGRKIVSKTPGLALARDTGYRTMFVPSAWETHPLIRFQPPSTATIVVMWIITDPDCYRLAVEIRLGNPEHRKRILNYAKSHQELFNPVFGNLSPNYCQIYRRVLVTPKQFAAADFGVAEQALHANWTQFVTQDLPKLEQAIIEALA
jgi:hypothetical protein